jgi:hypothetical protein
LVEDFDGITLRFKVNEAELSRFEKAFSESTPLEKSLIIILYQKNQYLYMMIDYQLLRQQFL